MVEFLRREYLEAGGALVRSFKDGRRYVTKEDVKARHPFIKDDLAKFVMAHPEILEVYKRLKSAKGAPDKSEIDEDFDEIAFTTALKDHLPTIPQGGDDAARYHSFAFGVCTFLFYPSLIYPIKERELHQGRKRVDIKFTNAAERGFFLTILQGAQTRANSVLIECKNYTKEINNPELDQLAGRFGHQRGFFGMLLCRRMDDRQRIIERCRDAVNDGRGYMIVMEDRDLVAMLEMVEAGRRAEIDRFLAGRYDEITH